MTRYEWHPLGIEFVDNINLLGGDIRTIERHANVLLNACKDIDNGA